MPACDCSPAQLDAATDAVWHALNARRQIALSKAECRDAAIAVLEAAKREKPKLSTGGVGAGPMAKD